MSLRLRLTLILGSAFILLWSLAAAWMLCDLRGQMMRSFDQRLAASARMVAGLLQQLPQPQPADGQTTRLSAEQLGIPNGMACQVSSLRGEVLAQSHATPERALDSTASGFRDQEINGVLWRSFTVQAGDLRVSTADRLEERDVLQRSVVVAAAVPVTVALLGSLALLWLGAGQGLAPLKRIRDALTRRGADSLEPLELAALPSELKPLVETQNQLFQRIAQAIERERRLTGDAAHELRSPLTAIKTHLQVARMTEGAAAEQALAHAEEGADRLQKPRRSTWRARSRELCRASATLPPVRTGTRSSMDRGISASVVMKAPIGSGRWPGRETRAEGPRPGFGSILYHAL